MAIIQDNPVPACTRIPLLWILLEQVTTGATRRDKRQSYHQHQHTNTQLSTSWMPFRSPKQQYQSTKGRKYHIPHTCSLQAHLGCSIFALTSKGSSLPWRRVAKPIVSPLTPLPRQKNVYVQKPLSKIIMRSKLSLCCCLWT